MGFRNLHPVVKLSITPAYSAWSDMLLDVYCPRPMRPLKRRLEDIDPDCPPASKHPRLPSPSSTPSIENQHSQIKRLSSCQPQSSTSRKRVLDEIDLDCVRATKHCRLCSSALCGIVQSWVSKVSRSSNYSTLCPDARASSAPPRFSGREQQCKNVMKSMLDYGVKVRQPAIRRALAQLNPVPSHWKKSRAASTVTETETPVTSFGAEESRSSKSRRRC